MRNLTDPYNKESDENDESSDDLPSLRKKLSEIFEKVSDLERQQAESPASSKFLTPPARSKSGANLLASDVQKNRRQRRAAPAPPPTPPARYSEDADPMMEQMNMMKA